MEEEAAAAAAAEEARGVLYTATMSSSTSSYGSAMKLINNIFNSDFGFTLKREEEEQPLQSDCAGEGASGRDYALVSAEMWLQALKWHSDSNVASRDVPSFSAAADDMSDVYPLQLRLSVVRETKSLAIKISKKDNTVELYKRAYRIFNVENELLRIWDFSGQTTLFFMNDRNKYPQDCHRQSDQEILLELQVYGLSDTMKCRETKKDEMALQQSRIAVSPYGGLHTGNGNTDSNFLTKYTTLGNNAAGTGALGLTGLQNLGNTCFMNSAIQCLAHTPKLVDYFLGDYSKEINQDNPLSMDGELALAFGDLLRKLWAPGAAPVAPRLFKSKLSHFAPQFSGFNQHDSQELLAFLLDGLHEDLNRVKCKPYVEAKDADGRPDEEVADEYWRNHLARNDSIVVDICHGQYRSTLVCPVCSKVSVTFDPLVYLSLPLPSTTMRTMTVTVLSSDGSSKPLPFTVTVPKHGKCKDLIQALSNACSLKTDETLLVAEIYSNHVIRYLEDTDDSLSLIRDDDRLVAYRLLKDNEKHPLLVFTHERLEEQYIHMKATSCWKAFGIPLVARLCDVVNGSDIQNLFLTLFKPFQRYAAVASDDSDDIEGSGNSEVEMEEDLLEDPHEEVELEFFLADEKGVKINESKIEMNEPVSLSRRLNVLVRWVDKKIEQCDPCFLSPLPEILRSGFLSKRPPDSVSLYSCLEAFLKEEPLGPEDMWYCPGCKKPRQAKKKLDLWRLPEILIIHLKRFSYSRFIKNKLETFVDFPVHDLDLSNYIAYKNSKPSHRYMLYAVSNHYGTMGGGHYTAFVYHGGNQWFEFDDSRVDPISAGEVKTTAAYVLFYRRTTNE
ncbi:hypothetical protein Scep_003490 [Stephania cephalantha]|uniref:Ubiquitin carboxyl-terminal hydrolase n=1 Tax=Stephania cephalantha TaxID=152367 RepID=A0AAP0KQQ9_9MAGN